MRILEDPHSLKDSLCTIVILKVGKYVFMDIFLLCSTKRLGVGMFYLKKNCGQQQHVFEFAVKTKYSMLTGNGYTEK